MAEKKKELDFVLLLEEENNALSVASIQSKPNQVIVVDL